VLWSFRRDVIAQNFPPGSTTTPEIIRTKLSKLNDTCDSKHLIGDTKLNFPLLSFPKTNIATSNAHGLNNFSTNVWGVLQKVKVCHFYEGTSKRLSADKNVVIQFELTIVLLIPRLIFTAVRRNTQWSDHPTGYLEKSPSKATLTCASPTQIWN